MNELNVYSFERRPRFDAEDRGFVYAVARRIVGTAEDAEDVTQDAMLLAYRHRDSFRGDARYRTWLHRIAATTALGFLRKRRRSREAPGEPLLATQLPDPRQSPEAELSDAQTRHRVLEAVATLEPKYRDVLLCQAAGAVTETASRLGISVSNVKVRAHRARKQLRPVLEAMR